jgi:hypothetical protein
VCQVGDAQVLAGGVVQTLFDELESFLADEVAGCGASLLESVLYVPERPSEGFHVHTDDRSMYRRQHCRAHWPLLLPSDHGRTRLSKYSRDVTVDVTVRQGLGPHLRPRAEEVVTGRCATYTSSGSSDPPVADRAATQENFTEDPSFLIQSSSHLRAIILIPGLPVPGNLRAGASRGKQRPAS